jgi:hypothetical protein
MAENYTYSQNNLIGSYSYKNRQKTKTPRDFNYNISASLEDLHNSLIDLIYPNAMSTPHRWNLQESDRRFLTKVLGMFPRELEAKIYQDSTEYPDNLLKYIVFGDPSSNTKTNSTRTFSKIGIAYGFTTETAYVVDLVTEKDFFLSITMYTNQNKTINDGIYQYEQISKPFFGKLGMLLLEHEASRSQPFSPDFSQLKSFYE